MPTTTICNAFKQSVLEGRHSLKDEFKIALYLDGSGLSKDTEVYTKDGESTDANKAYSAGGIVLAGAKVAMDGDTAILTFDSPITLENASISARYALIYNASQGNRAVLVFDFGKTVSATDGPFVITLPDADAVTGLIRVA